MQNLTQIITKEIKDNFNHEFLSCKANVIVEITDKNVKITNLIDSTDQDAFYYDEEGDDTEDEYISQEEENEQLFYDDAYEFVYDILEKHLGRLEAEEYRISFLKSTTEQQNNL